MTYGDTSEDRGVGIDGDMVLDDRMTGNIQHVAVLIVAEALGTKRHTLIEGDVVADDGGLANDDARAVVDSKILADLGTWVNVDTRL